MQATSEKVVSIDYTLKDGQGTVIDTSQGRGPLAYLHGAGNIIPGLERELEGKTAGAAFEVTVLPTDAYGERDDALVQPVPKSRFPEGANPQVGQQFQAQTPTGARMVTVVNVEAESVTIDANHPLAGQSLHFAGQVVDVRDATQQELQHGHVHGPGGHSH
jgi:FKBP-type peptidyl-prolyl cis-trans isomerase SlyD